MKKPTKRKAFNFLRSYFDILNELEKDSDKLSFLLSIINKQFLDEDPEGLNYIVKLCYESQRHVIEKSVKGYTDRMKTDVFGMPLQDPSQDPPQGGSQGPPEQEEEKEKEEDIVKECIIEVSNPPIGVSPLYFYIAKSYHNLFLKKGSTKSLRKAKLDKWVDEVRKIIELDKVKVEQLVAVKMYWELCEEGVERDRFWYDTVNSMASFRKKDKHDEYYFDKITQSVKKWLDRNPQYIQDVKSRYNNLMDKTNGSSK